MLKLLANPYALLAGGVLLIASHGYAYFHGRGDGAAHVQARYAKATEKALRAMRKGAAAINLINGAYAVVLDRQAAQNRSIRDAADHILPRPIYATACVDADGVGLLDRARAAGNVSLDPGEPAGGSP